MIDPDLRFRSEQSVDAVNDEIVIAGEVWHRVVLHAGYAIPAMVSQVVDHQVEIIKQE